MTFTAIDKENKDSLVISPNIITKMNKSDFQTALNGNPGGLIIKFGAEWCGPCKRIDPFIYTYMNNLPEIILGAILEIDDNFVIYAHLKSKKQVSGVPVILFYKKGNVSWAADKVVIGADQGQINLFFQDCFTSI